MSRANDFISHYGSTAFVLYYAQGGDSVEFLFDILVEAFFELFGEGFVSLCSAFVPKRAISEKGKTIISYVCFAISLALLVGLFVGIIVLIETKGQCLWGWLLITLNVIYLLIAIILKIVSYIKN